MQILLNQTDLTHAVLGYVNDFINVPEGATVSVEVGEDSTAVIYINEDTQERESESTASTTERPAKKPRRTKAQIEADNKAEATRLAEAQAAAASSGNEQVTQTTSVEDVTITEDAPNSDAGGQPDEQVDPQLVESAVVVTEEATASDPEPEPETTVEPETPPVRQSLFANLRKPQNG